MIERGNQNDAIQNAICDFLNTCKISKKDSVFSVQAKSINEQILGISILGEKDKLIRGSENKIGTRHDDTFPTKYIIQQGKLFYWYDSDSYITHDLISVLSKYSHIDSLVTNANGIIEYPKITRDDSQKGVDYYFCKKNLLKYKRVITSVSMGWYDAPSLKCDD